MSELAVYGAAQEVVQQQQSMQSAAVERLAEWAQAAQAAYQVSERLVKTSFVPAAFRDKPMEATAAILAGSEVGLSPMGSLRSFDIIQGTAAPRAITLRAIVQSQGHDVWVKESTNSRAVVCGKRRGSNVVETSTWTIDRARDLGLAGKDNWKKQPAAMLVARATSEVCRLIAADAILGIGYTVEEIGDGAGPQPVEQPPAQADEPQQPAARTRKLSRASTRAQRDVASPPADPPPPDGGDEQPEESPLLNTSSTLAKAMFAKFNDIGISERDARLAYVNRVIAPREVSSSTEMTDADANAVIKAIDWDLDHQFGGDEPSPDDAS